MFNSWMFYIILGLSASTAGLGWLSLSLHDDKVIAEQALVVAINVNSDMQKSLNLRDLSCKQDIVSTIELEADKTALKDKTETISQEISKLSTGVKKPAINNIITEAPKNAEESHVLTGGELLSDDLRKLLLQAYCNVESDSEQCLPSRQSVGASVQSHTSG